MKRITAGIAMWVAAMAPAVAAEAADNPQSPPDANPACMQINGPDCVLPSAVYPPRVASPRDAVVAPPVIVTPAAPAEPALAPGQQRSTIISPRQPGQGLSN